MDMVSFKVAIIGFELLAGIIGIIKWQNIKNTYWKYFPFYLILIAMLENMLYYWLPKLIVNYIDTFILIPGEFLFFFWLFYKNSQKKLPIIIGSCVYILSFVAENIFAEKINKGYFLSFSYSIGNLILLIFILQYFYYLIFTERILFFYRERMFWVASGLLIFY